jgi:hypothetical protein
MAMNLEINEVVVTVPDRLLTTAETVAVLRKSPLTLDIWRLRQEGPPCIKLNGRSIRYSQRMLEKWIADRTVTPSKGHAASEY